MRTGYGYPAGLSAPNDTADVPEDVRRPFSYPCITDYKDTAGERRCHLLRLPVSRKNLHIHIQRMRQDASPRFSMYRWW